MRKLTTTVVLFAAIIAAFAGTAAAQTYQVPAGHEGAIMLPPGTTLVLIPAGTAITVVPDPDLPSCPSAEFKDDGTWACVNAPADPTLLGDNVPTPADLPTPAELFETARRRSDETRAAWAQRTLETYQVEQERVARLEAMRASRRTRVAPRDTATHTGWQQPEETAGDGSRFATPATSLLP